VEIGERAGLDWSSDIEAFLFQGLREIGHEDVTDFVFSGMIQDEAEGAVAIVMANQNNRPMEKRAAELTAVQ
jgi:hypothetical protein